MRNASHPDDCEISETLLHRRVHTSWEFVVLDSEKKLHTFDLNVVATRSTGLVDPGLLEVKAKQL